jgi:hypothetical protein
MSTAEYSNEKIAVSAFFGGTGVSPVQGQAIAFAINSFHLEILKSP